MLHRVTPEAPGQSGGRGSMGRPGHQPSLQFQWEGTWREGSRLTGLGLASWINLKVLVHGGCSWLAGTQPWGDAWP